MVPLASPAGRALQHPVFVRVAEPVPGRVARNAGGLGVAHQVVLVFFPGRRLQGLDGTGAQRFLLVRNHQPPVHTNHPAKALAGLARARRRVEGKHRRQRLGIAQVAVGAVQPGGKTPQRGFGLAVHHAVHRQPPAAAFQRHLDGLDGARLLGQADAKAVGHHVQQLDAGARTARHQGFALGLHACETAGRQPLRHLVGAGIGRQLDRKRDNQPGIVLRRARTHFGIDRLGRIVPHRLRSLAVKQLASAGKQQFEVVVQLGHGADRRARAAHRVGLVDGNGRRHAVHLVDCRLVHAVQKLARIGAEGFHIAALAFGVQRVEHQARLARAAGAGDDGQLAGANVQVQVLKVVLSRSADADQSLGHVRRSFWGGGSDSVASPPDGV